MGADAVTSGGTYLVVHGRLWRRSNPALAEKERASNLIAGLMAAWRDRGQP
jgi:hypothetical protein